MTCQETQELIHAYTDGELDLAKSLEVENHLRDCNPCAMIHRNLISLRSSIRDGSLYHRAPATLEREIRSQVKRARVTATGRGNMAIRWFAAAAAIALVTGTVWIALHGLSGGQAELLVSEITSAHIRSLMAEHLSDVKSSDQHTVKPWFEGKLDFAPDVRDFKADSFALEGGRLDYLADRPVAALVYRHDKHYINLFIWPERGHAGQDYLVSRRQGYVLAHWIQAGMNYWAVSDMNEDLLQRFTALIRNSGTPGTMPIH